MRRLEGFVQEDIAIVKEEYPEADDVAILERLVEIGAHPMTISFQMERVQDSQGQERKQTDDNSLRSPQRRGNRSSRTSRFLGVPLAHSTVISFDPSDDREYTQTQRRGNRSSYQSRFSGVPLANSTLRSFFPSDVQEFTQAQSSSYPHEESRSSGYTTRGCYSPAETTNTSYEESSSSPVRHNRSGSTQERCTRASLDLSDYEGFPVADTLNSEQSRMRSSLRSSGRQGVLGKSGSPHGTNDQDSCRLYDQSLPLPPFTNTSQESAFGKSARKGSSYVRTRISRGCRTDRTEHSLEGSTLRMVGSHESGRRTEQCPKQDREASQVTTCELKRMLMEEKEEIRKMKSLMSKVEIPQPQECCGTNSFIRNSIFDEVETAPEVAAAILHADERGLSLSATPAKVYDSLFRGSSTDRTIIKVNSPYSHIKRRIVVPLSSEGGEASLLGNIVDGFFKKTPDSQLPPLKEGDKEEMRNIEDNLGISLSSLEKEKESKLSVNEEGRFKITLQPEFPREHDLIQVRGSQPPTWFPGYYVMMGDDVEVNVIDKPWTVLDRAWQQFVPEKMKCDPGKIILGS